MSWGEIFNTDEPEPWESAEEDDEDESMCTRCGGSGLTPEGWDCHYCDGEGWLPI